MAKKDILDNKTYYSFLLSIYGDLLTKINKRRMVYFYFEDYSLSEIATIEKVSRNAIYESIKNSKNYLKSIDSKLSLSIKIKRIILLLDKIEEEENVEKMKKIIEKLKEEFDYGI